MSEGEATALLLNAGPMLTFLAESMRLPSVERLGWERLLREIATDSTLAPHTRAAAVRSASSLASGAPIDWLENALGAGAPELQRAVALAWSREGTEDSARRLERLAAQCVTPRAFDTVCFALGNHNHHSAFDALLRLAPSEGEEPVLSWKAALSQRPEDLARVLSDASHPMLAVALQAVRYSDAKTQKVTILPLLTAIVLGGRHMPEAAGTAVKQIIEMVNGLSIAEGNTILASLEPALAGRPDLASHAEFIRARLSAVHNGTN